MYNLTKEWSQTQREEFKDLYKKYGIKYCSDYFNKSKNSITRIAKELDVKFGKIKLHFQSENFVPIVQSASSISDIIRRLGLKAAGGNHKLIKNYIKKYEIDISHFKIHDAHRLSELAKKKAIPLEEIMVENSTYSRTHLKTRLYKEGIKKRECELCGQGEIWQGKKMSLILDHINGKNNDHRRENLQVICPNCAGTLDTHCGKNNKKKSERNFCLDCKSPISDSARHCIKCAKHHYKQAIIKRCPDCNKEIESKSTYCFKCCKNHYGPQEHRRKIKNRPPIQQLKLDVFNLGYRGTGRKYGVSDTAIRKWVQSQVM